MKVEFIYPKYYDLIFHVMAYFKVNNASNLYNENYILKMSEKKVGFAYNIIPAVNSLQDYYNENFDRLMLINFLPYYCNGYEEMKNSLLTYNRFTQDDLKYFIKPFIEILDNESMFFFKYWETLNNRYELARSSTENYFKQKLEKYSCIFDYFRKPCKVLFSYSITQNGRGFYSDSHFAALVCFPENEFAYDFSFIQLLHEYTHNFTDSLLNKNINMKDGSHNLSELIVIVADYFLIKSLDETFIPKYFDWIKKECSEELDEAKFLSLFSFDKNLYTELINLINKILDSRIE